MGGTCSTHVERKNACTFIGGKPRIKIWIVRRRHRWKDNIKLDLKEIGSEDVGWLHLAQDKVRWRALVKAVMNLRMQK
jgi:hypothetical protein